MIFVTVGTDNHDFSRLVKWMDSLSAGRKVVMQIGNTKYEPLNAEWFRFESNQRIAELYSRSGMIVTHAGAGSIMRSLLEGKKPIVVPRLRRYGEHVNDHQLDLARSLSQRGMIALANDPATLSLALKRSRIMTRRPSALKKRLAAYLEAL